ncbi:MAG: heme-binding protein [Asticcacaulis sp.]
MPGPSLQVSLDLAKAAIAACTARGLAASVSVVDSAGLVKVILRADGAPKPPVAAPLKAATAAKFDAPGFGHGATHRDGRRFRRPDGGPQGHL